MDPFDVYGIGNALVDTEYQVSVSFLDQLGLSKGVMTLVDEDEQMRLVAALNEIDHAPKRAGGGSAANTVVTAAQLGIRSFYTCKVANDPSGDFFVADLARAGVSTNLGSDRDDGVTGECVSLVTPDADRTLQTHLGITESLSTQELDADALAGCRWLYIEGYLVTSPTAFAAALEAQAAVRKNGGKVSLTLSDPAIVEAFKPSFDQLFEAGIDLTFCNEDEAKLWAGETNTDATLAALAAVSPEYAYTMGKDGAVVSDGSSNYRIAGKPVAAVDTTGAGDTFAGVFLAGICNGLGYEEAAQRANNAAAAVVTRFGARLTTEELNAALRG